MMLPYFTAFLNKLVCAVVKPVTFMVAVGSKYKRVGVEELLFRCSQMPFVPTATESPVLFKFILVLLFINDPLTWTKTLPLVKRPPFTVNVPLIKRSVVAEAGLLPSLATFMFTPLFTTTCPPLLI